MDYIIDHDIHIHTKLSSCSSDENMVKDSIIAFAVAEGYKSLCFTDHTWDKDVPGASQWYSTQDIDHVRKTLPIPKKIGDLKIYFGCETEFVGGGKIGINEKNFSLFDFIIIPPNHYHMVDFVRPGTITGEEETAKFFMTRLEELTELNLPWEKIGIAHLSTKLIYKTGDHENVFKYIARDRMLKVFDFFAKKGTGIELNADCFKEDNNFDERPSTKVYRLAKEAGCKFYCGSDAHHLDKLDYNRTHIHDFVKYLGLKESDKYIIPDA